MNLRVFILSMNEAMRQLFIHPFAIFIQKIKGKSTSLLLLQITKVKIQFTAHASHIFKLGNGKFSSKLCINVMLSYTSCQSTVLCCCKSFLSNFLACDFNWYSHLHNNIVTILCDDNMDECTHHKTSANIPQLTA